MVDGFDPATPPPVEMIAFVVEGYGAFLVPLAVLAPYRVDTNPLDDDPADLPDSVGWGWQLPTVHWNTFDAGQANRPIALGPGLTTRLDPALFLAALDHADPPDEHR